MYVMHEWFNEPDIVPFVPAEAFRCPLKGFVEHDRIPIIEGMSDGGWGQDPIEPEFIERKLSIERREYAHRMNCRADIVNEARKRELPTSRASTDFFSGFDYPNGCAISRELDCCGEAVGT